MRTKVGRIAILAGLAGATLVAAPAPAATTVRLSGTQTIVDEAKGAYRMHGTLVGDWQVTSFIPQVKTGTELVASGKEVFAGCIDANMNGNCDATEPAGKINFTYLFYGTFDPKTKTEISGQCLHPVMGGSGAFTKATGVIEMADTLVRKTLRTTYSGTLTLPERHRKPSASPPTIACSVVCKEHAIGT
jgi:hypothetical protein